MKKRTLKEVESSERKWTGRACALSALVRTLNLPVGWRFVCSPRGYEAWILFVDDRGYVQEYSANLDDRAARELRAYELRRSHAESEHFGSLCAALDAEATYIAHAIGQGSVPFSQPFVVST
jgi:hypothetical protein